MAKARARAIPESDRVKTLREQADRSLELMRGEPAQEATKEVSVVISSPTLAFRRDPAAPNLFTHAVGDATIFFFGLLASWVMYRKIDRVIGWLIRS